MKKHFSHLLAIPAQAGISLALAFGLIACGDTVENVNQTGVELFSSAKDLPKCNDKNEGDLAVVSGESALRVCMGGEWTTMVPEGAYVDSDLNCSTEELKDGSGLKIICNGDSIGVVLNGSDGKAGKDGKDGSDGEDGKDAVLPKDTLESDSERVPVSLDSLAGFSQKGPFLKGSTVYLYELSDGRTLKQTNGNFTSYITRDDGRYKFSARDLTSQYAMIVVEGNYRNEVTGVPSNAPIRLRALTDMRKRSDANINLLTTLEFDRVYHLVTRGDSTGKKLTVKQAKRQAQKEIMKQFHIELDENTDAEDLDVFGATDADAALLAISILLQGDGSETDLSVLLTEIANDIETDGTWDDASAVARLADWVAEADADGRLGTFRKNVRGWNLSDTVPVFEKFLRNYYSVTNKLGKCGGKDVPAGTVMNVKNPKSKYYAKEYTDTTNRVRFICLDADSARWRIATEIEKDTAGLGHEFEEGNVSQGKVNKEFVYVYQDSNWRHGTALDSVVGEGCMPSRGDNVVLGKDGLWYKCIGDSSMYFLQDNLIEADWTGAWRKASNLERDTNGLGHDFSNGAVHRGGVDTSLVYVYEEGNWIAGTLKDDSVGVGCVTSLDGSIVKGRDGVSYICNIDYANGISRIWNKAPNISKDTAGWAEIGESQGGWKNGDLRYGNVYTSQLYVYQDGAWRVATGLERELQQACVTPGDTSINQYSFRYYVCTDNAMWSALPMIYGDTKDYREDCKNGTYSDGRLLSGKVMGSNKYVCENGEIRVATSLEFVSGIGCVAKTRNQIYRVAGVFVKCLTEGFSKVTTKARGVMKDNAGQEYQTVVIGSQHWMAENLNYATDSSYCYENNEANCASFGRLYSRTASRTVCPAGWHLPSRNEWGTLFAFAGCSNLVERGYCEDAGYVFKSAAGWVRSANTLNGVDTYGFTVLPAGFGYNENRSTKTGRVLTDYWAYAGLRYQANLWSYNPSDTTKTESVVFVDGYRVTLYTQIDPDTYVSDDDIVNRRGYYQYSVRCIQD